MKKGELLYLFEINYTHHWDSFDIQKNSNNKFMTIRTRKTEHCSVNNSCKVYTYRFIWVLYFKLENVKIDSFSPELRNLETSLALKTHLPEVFDLSNNLGLWLGSTHLIVQIDWDSFLVFELSKILYSTLYGLNVSRPMLWNGFLILFLNLGSSMEVMTLRIK